MFPDDHWIEKTQTPYFYIRNRAPRLLLTQPTQTGTRLLLEQDFEQSFSVDQLLIRDRHCIRLQFPATGDHYARSPKTL